MSTLNVNTINPVQANEPLNFQTGGTTFVQLTTAGVLSGVGATVPTISNFNGLGQVLSVQSKSSDLVTSFSADSWVVWDSNLNITVTPQSVSSKFLLSYSTLTGNSSQRVFVRFVREVSSSDTSVGRGAASSGRLQCNSGNYMAGGANFHGLAGQFLDDPDTTSAITYKLEVYSNSGTGYLNRSSEDADNDSSPRGLTVVTVMEIAG
jgi:hypothetical protein